MNYYRLTFNRITIPNPDKEPLNRHWDWYQGGLKRLHQRH